MDAKDQVTLLGAGDSHKVTQLRCARARTQTQAAGSKCSVWLFLLFYTSFPAQNPPWIPVDCGTKSKPLKWPPWLLRAKPQGTRVALSCGERVGVIFLLSRVQLGLSRSWDFHPERHPSAAGAQLRCFVPISHRSHHQRRLQVCSHPGNVPFVPFMSPFVA